MEDLDSLLQDLEKATSTLKNHPISAGGSWKLNKPNDHTISSQPAYTTAKVAKRYSPQYYVNDEPLYQNEQLFQRVRSPVSNQTASSEHDYAAINGRQSRTESMSKPTSPIYAEGTKFNDNYNYNQKQQKPFSYTSGKMPGNASDHYNTSSNDVDVLSEKISLINNLLKDLDATRENYERYGARPRNASPIDNGRSNSNSRLSPASYAYSYSTLPVKHSSPNYRNEFYQQNTPIGYKSLERHVTFEPVNKLNQVPNGGAPNYLVNGNSSRQQREHSADSDQVNDLIRNLEYDLRNTSLPYKNKSSLSNGSAMHARSSSQSPTQSPRIQQVSEYNRQLVNITPQKAQMNNNPVIEVPLPAGHGPTSNATRELDDLMASLTDFKMNQVKTPSKSNYISLGKIQVPSKGTYAPILNSDLDSMIGNLEVDLNRQGINTTTKGTCGACGKIIIGQVVTALGTTWHPEHFTCAKCQRELGDMTFFERDGLAYCEQDYHRLYSPKCNYCNKPIYDRCITALDKTWHPEHFCCAHCGKNFGDEGYHEKAGNAYCREDFFKLFAPKCSGCVKPIEDNYVTALGGQWHQDCFVCRDCKSPFTDDKTYFDFEGRPYCEPHYHDKRGNLCVSCRQPITGRCITAMGHKYHPEHFICSFCLKQLNKGTFKKHTDKPYCHSCFDKLFA